jgi:predicted nucleic acid-binding protein
MKGLDTPVLLALLRGSPEARKLARSLGSGELATTEVNLFELETIARQSRAPGRERRLQALERLRRRLTLLPVDEESSRRAAALAGASRQRAPEGGWLMWGAAEAHGCTEWITDRRGAPPRGKTRLRISVIPTSRTKSPSERN